MLCFPSQLDVIIHDFTYHSCQLQGFPNFSSQRHNVEKVLFSKITVTVRNESGFDKCLAHSSYVDFDMLFIVVVSPK